MTSRINLDFYVRGPERRQCVRERMARQRAPMYEWRHDFAESAFDAATGERRPLQRVFNPVPKRHLVSARDTRAAARSVDESIAFDDVEQGSTGPQQQQRSRHRWNPQYTLGDGGTAGIAVSSARPATATAWESAAQGFSDRRRAWKHTGFTFTEDYFRTSAHAPASQARRGVAVAASEAYRGAEKSGVYVPYLHDTILLCTPLPHPKDPRTSRSCGAAAAAAADPLPPVHRASSAAKVVLAVTCNAAESCVRELQASMEAKRRGLLNISALAPTHTSQPQLSASFQCTAGVESFTDDDGSDSSTRAGATGGLTSGSSYVGVAAAEPKGTCCDVFGPSIAVRQRAAALAEGVYTDLILNRAKAPSAALAVGVSKTEVPTCELAYSLRPSYVQSRLRRSAAAARRRSSSSSGSRSSRENVGIVGITSDCYSASLDAGASGTTQHTTAVTSPITGYASAPRICDHRAHGVSEPPFERAVTRSPANESLAGMAPPPAMATAATDAISFVARSGNTAHHSSTTTAPPPALSPMELGRDGNNTEEGRSPDSIDGRATPKASRASAARAGRRQGRRSTASPLPGGGTLQLHPDLHPSPSLLYRTCNSTDSPTLLCSYGDGGGSTVAGGSNYDGGSDERQGRCPHERHSKESRHQSPDGQSGRERTRHNAQQQHQHRQPPLTVHRLPVVSKETRVYAVRVRRLFTKADAAPLKRSERPRRGIPVMLPQDWRPNC
ncbi:hypothetical protein LSCM4_08351 [Leishmania orientalis]|uniref:Uncharacterized protein n=1 Tax=Leishmania orientalis TaxID=2249476 RepID=A0A836HBB2_9TRYP|nr:hypothetical protein LSCM4_08351 [Leishmania orientalis]